MLEKFKPVKECIVVVDAVEDNKDGRTDVFLEGDYPVPYLDSDLLAAVGVIPSTLSPGDELGIQITVHRKESNEEEIEQYDCVIHGTGEGPDCPRC